MFPVGHENVAEKEGTTQHWVTVSGRTRRTGDRILPESGPSLVEMVSKEAVFLLDLSLGSCEPGSAGVSHGA